jgi:hypothetical protein
MNQYTINPATATCDRCYKPVMTLLARKDQWVCLNCRFDQPSNKHEIARRTELVKKAVPVLQTVKVTPEEFASMSLASWNRLAAVIGAKHISLETRVAIGQALEDSHVSA